jgi:hypothetical protein
MRRHVEEIASLLAAGIVLFVVCVESAASKPQAGSGQRKFMDDPISCQICIGDCDSPTVITQECPEDFPDSCASVYNRDGVVLAKGCARRRTRSCDLYHAEIFQLGRQLPDNASRGSSSLFSPSSSSLTDGVAYIACYCSTSDQCNREYNTYLDEQSQSVTSVRKRTEDKVAASTFCH